MNHFNFGKSLARKNAQKRRRAAKSLLWRKEIKQADQDIKEGKKVV